MTTPTETKALVERLRELAEKATPTPWFQWPTKDGGRVCAQFPVEGEEPLSIADFDMDQRLDYDTTSCANAALVCVLSQNLPTILAALEPLTREPDADEVERERQLDEAREEGFQEGYAEGQDDANHASKDTFHAVIAWLRKRDFLQPCDYPEGYTAEDIAEALNEHEENLVCLSKRAALTEEPGHG